MTGWLPADRIEPYLLAADVAVQLRTYARAPLSGALLDCIAFGVPTVTTSSLAVEMQAPSFVRGIAELSDAQELAEAIEPLLDRRRSDSVHAIDEERRDWLSQRTTDLYARRLLEALGLGGYSG